MPEMILAGRPLGPEHPPLVIAEIGINHEGDYGKAVRMVDEAHRVGCECAEDERVVVEPDGYTWTTPHDGPCRGCELRVLTGKACPLHGGMP